ncbi:AraC family transcriptional regulator [Massilia arenae]|uniref:Helix-turn-helix transcriptional regulator n=1 Tax=Massilia arenae TaxID=2603288 RepID=A0A5C7FP64_9BURK|nr:AraC family transcriptional regulator [Massilia arenae]TXF96399.1 helix-turn-helix transcriptional regulator [Massilia arenae]
MLPPLPHNIIGLTQAGRAWSGVQLLVTGYDCDGEGTSVLPHRDHARLSVVLEEHGGACEPRLQPHRPCPVEHVPRHMYFAPAGMEIWGHTKYARRVVDAVLMFDLDVLSERLETTLDPDRIGVPRLRFANDRIWNLVKLLSEAVHNPDPSMHLYGDGIITAVSSQLFAAPRITEFKAGGLAPWQLRRVIDYMDANLPHRIELDTLATLVNLSQAHFSRAFKISTGLAPYQWQLDARIRRAQLLLSASDASLGEVAHATGFADPVHFGRTFRKMMGLAPGAWRTEHKR